MWVKKPQFHRNSGWTPSKPGAVSSWISVDAAFSVENNAENYISALQVVLNFVRSYLIFDIYSRSYVVLDVAKMWELNSFGMTVFRASSGTLPLSSLLSSDQAF